MQLGPSQRNIRLEPHMERNLWEEGGKDVRAVNTRMNENLNILLRFIV